MPESTNERYARSLRFDLYVLNRWGCDLSLTTSVAWGAWLAVYISDFVSSAGVSSMEANIISCGNTAIFDTQLSHYVTGLLSIPSECA